MEADLTQQRIGAAFQPSWLKIPSLSDLFYLFFTIWSFLVSPVGWQRLLLDADSAFHTRIGEHILLTGSVPRTDVFSYSKPGETWYAFEWLSETVFALVFNLASYKGLVLLAGTLIALYVTILLKYTMWRGANGLVALLAVLIGASATSVHYYARPHLFTLLFLAVAMWVLEYNRRKGGNLIWVLAPMTAVWANLHGGFAIFFVLLVLRIVGCIAEGYFWQDQRAERFAEGQKVALVAGACAFASLANPYGWALHEHLLETLRNPWIQANVSEFLSPDFRTEELFHFMALLFAGLGCIAPLVRKRKLVEPVAILVLAYASLVSVRHLTIFVLVAVPVIAGEFSEFWETLTSGSTKASVLGLLREIAQTVTLRMPGTGAFVPLVIVVLAIVPGIPWPTEFPGESMPVSLIETHHELLAGSRVFGPDQVGDYLVFRNYPKQKVFFDSRHNYYGPELGDEYLTVLQGLPKWHQLLDKYAVNVLLIRKEGALDSLAHQSGEWRSLATDGKFELLQRIGKDGL